LRQSFSFILKNKENRKNFELTDRLLSLDLDLVRDRDRVRDLVRDRVRVRDRRRECLEDFLGGVDPLDLDLVLDLDRYFFLTSPSRLDGTVWSGVDSLLWSGLLDRDLGLRPD